MTMSEREAKESAENLKQLNDKVAELEEKIKILEREQYTLHNRAKDAAIRGPSSSSFSWLLLLFLSSLVHDYVSVRSAALQSLVDQEDEPLTRRWNQGDCRGPREEEEGPPSPRRGKLPMFNFYCISSVSLNFSFFIHYIYYVICKSILIWLNDRRFGGTMSAEYRSKVSTANSIMNVAPSAWSTFSFFNVSIEFGFFHRNRITFLPSPIVSSFCSSDASFSSLLFLGWVKLAKSGEWSLRSRKSSLEAATWISRWLCLVKTRHGSSI